MLVRTQPGEKLIIYILFLLPTLREHARAYNICAHLELVRARDNDIHITFSLRLAIGSLIFSPLDVCGISSLSST